MVSIFRRWFQRKKAASKSAEELAGWDDLEWLTPPSNMHDPEAWDRYWHDQVSHGLGPPLFDMFLSDEVLIQRMSELSMRTVLCVGNGISQEPRVLAAGGFAVTVLDNSQVALQLAQRWDGESGTSQSQVYVVGDLLDPEICRGPFDVVIERRTLQLFAPEERLIALDALLARLQPEGIFVSQCHDARWKPPAEPVHVTKPLLLERGLTPWSGNPRRKPAGRVAWIETSTG